MALLFCLGSVGHAEERVSFLYLKQKFSGQAVTDAELLREVDPNWQNKTAILHHSRSSYVASPDYPRLLAFSADGRLAMAINTDPSHRLRPVVEILEQQNDGSLKPHVIDRTGSSARFIENPQTDFPSRTEFQCTRCHSQNIHLNWDGYPSWPEAFGARSGDKDKAELALFQRFLSSATKNQWDWFADFNPSFSMLKGNNLRITNLVHKNNSRRIVGIMKTSPQYERLKNAMIAAMTNSLLFKSFLNHEENALFQSEFPALVKEVKTGHLNYQDSVTKRFMGYGLPYRGVVLYETFVTYAKMEFVARAMGLNTSTWWTTLERSSFSSSAPTFTILEFEIARELVRDLNKNDPRYKWISLPTPLNFGVQSVGATLFSLLHLYGRATCEQVLSPQSVDVFD